MGGGSNGWCKKTHSWERTSGQTLANSLFSAQLSYSADFTLLLYRYLPDWITIAAIRDIYRSGWKQDTVSRRYEK